MNYFMEMVALFFALTATVSAYSANHANMTLHTNEKIHRMTRNSIRWFAIGLVLHSWSYVI